jgi:type IV pilus assembly protein PilW
MKKQQGTTLIELMVGLVLSLGLIAGISSLFLNMQKSNRIQRTLATMADDSGYVLEVLQKEIRRTGGLRSRSDSSGTNDRIFLVHADVLTDDVTITPRNVTGISFSGGAYIRGDASSPTNDAFAIRYQLLDAQDLSSATSSNGSSPCTQQVLLDNGEDPSLNPHVVNVYFHLNGTTLSCSAQRTLPDNSGLGTATEACAKNCVSSTDKHTVLPQIDLVNNVVKFVMRYGVDSDADGAANYYTDAAQVTTADWKNVISVRMTIVVRSPEDYLTNTKMTYQVEGEDITAGDYRLYKVFTTTIALRNQLI